jgi:hypothetical protein
MRERREKKEEHICKRTGIRIQILRDLQHMALRFPVRSHAGREIWVAVDESCGGLGIGGRGGLQTAV